MKSNVVRAAFARLAGVWQWSKGLVVFLLAMAAIAPALAQQNLVCVWGPSYGIAALPMSSPTDVSTALADCNTILTSAPNRFCAGNISEPCAVAGVGAMPAGSSCALRNSFFDPIGHSGFVQIMKIMQPNGNQWLWYENGNLREPIVKYTEYCGTQSLPPVPPTCTQAGNCIPDSASKSAGPGDTGSCSSSSVPTSSNPIVFGTGNKMLVETDFEAAGVSSPLKIIRTYNSAPSNRLTTTDLASHWTTNFGSVISVDVASAPTVAIAVRPDGKALRFNLVGNAWSAKDADMKDTLTPLGSPTNPYGWRYSRAVDDAVEEYDNNGLLLRINSREGLVQKFSYSGSDGSRLYGNASSAATSGYIAPACNRPSGFAAPANGGLLCVTDGFGRQINFGYDSSNRVSQFSDPMGQVYTYQFDTNNNLSGVIYPDSTYKTYLYENSNFKNALTGVVDENQVRYATYQYDSLGRAYSETLSGGAEAMTLSFEQGTTTVTDAVGSARTFGFVPTLGVQKSTGANQPAGSGCSAAANTMTYDGQGNVSSRTDFNGYKTTYAYDLTRNLETKRVEGLNGDGTSRSETRTTTTQWHNVWHLPAQIAEPLKLTTYVYNGDTYNGNVVSCESTGATVPNKTGTQFIGVLCQKIEQATTDADGSLGLSATITGAPRTWSYTYNPTGQILTSVGPRTDQFQITYYGYYTSSSYGPSALGNLRTVQNVLGHTTTLQDYDGNGHPKTIIDSSNVYSYYTYTPRGWIKTGTFDGKTTTYGYYNSGQLGSITRPDNSTVAYGYDGAHRLTSITDGQGNQQQWSLDALGNRYQTRWVNPDNTLAKQQKATFDALGRMQKAIETRNSVDYASVYGYDPNGNTQTVTDPKNKVTTNTYDALNRLVQIKDALLGLTNLAYDGRNQLVQHQAPGKAATNFTVDGLGNVTAWISADWGNQSATYDAAGNMLTLTDARGVVETHTYDVLDRPATVTYPLSGESMVYTWDQASGCGVGIGRLCQVTDNGGSTQFSYDARGNVVSETRTEGGQQLTASQYTWDDADRLVVQITPSSKLITIDRNLDGQQQQISTSVASQNVNLVSAVSRDAAGGVLAQTYGNSVSVSQTFNTDGTASRQVAVAPGGATPGNSADIPTLPEWAALILGGTLLLFAIKRRRHDGMLGVVVLLAFTVAPRASWADEALTYDANGNVQTRALSGGTTTYGYDALNRLNSESGPTKTQTVIYDANDNRSSDAAGTKTYVANSDRLATENGSLITMDTAGNITQARGLTFEWYQRAGEIKKVSRSGALLATYYYDYKGRRTRKVTTSAAPQGAATIIYTYDLQDRLTTELNGTGIPLRTYVWRDEVPTSIIINASPEYALYLEADHLGTPIAARNQAGSVVWRWESDAFGSVLPNDDPGRTGTHTTINLRYPGMYFDQESGLLYNWHRYYDPVLGRYMSPDLIGVAGGKNPYTYVGANPLTRTDPQGLMIYQKGPSYTDNPSGDGWSPYTPSAPLNLVPSPSPLSSSDMCNAQGRVAPSAPTSMETSPAYLIPSSVSAGLNENCQALRNSILNTCASLSGGARTRCVGAANVTYRQCMSQI